MDAKHSDARSAIFASIRENLAASAAFNSAHQENPDQPDWESSSNLAKWDLLETFRNSLDLVGATCVFVENESEAADRLSEMVMNPSAKKIVVSDSELVRRLVKTAKIEAIENASRGELFSSDFGITSAQWAIAETGTLVLESGAERHRLVSLVPAVHVCVLTAVSIRASMAEILELVDPDTNRTITFITGASRTSDIELTLAIGVHGPGDLRVIVIKDQ